MCVCTAKIRYAFRSTQILPVRKQLAPPPALKSAAWTHAVLGGRLQFVFVGLEGKGSGQICNVGGELLVKACRKDAEHI